MLCKCWRKLMSLFKQPTPTVQDSETIGGDLEDEAEKVIQKMENEAEKAFKEAEEIFDNMERNY